MRKKMCLILIFYCLGNLTFATNDTSEIREAEVFGVAVMEALFARDTHGYIESWDSMIYFINKDTVVTKVSFEKWLSFLGRNSLKVDSFGYLDSFSPMVFKVSKFINMGSEFKEVFSKHRFYTPKENDYIFLGSVLRGNREPARRMRLVIDDGMELILRKYPSGWKIIAML